MSTRAVTPKTKTRNFVAATIGLHCADFVSSADLSPQETENVLALASLMKARPKEFRTALADKQIVLMFEKPSLRTRVTFEAGMASMGGKALFIDQRSEPIGKREPVCDVARNLERWIDGIVLRTFEHSTVTQMAEFASVPVINALTDLEHPCQALADYLTLTEHFGSVKRLKLAYVGDGNNVAHSLLLTAATLGSSIAIATPQGYEPKLEVVLKAAEIAKDTGAKISVTHDPEAAVAGADAVYTDVWASMGQEDEAEQRRRQFAFFQVNEELFAQASPEAVFMHCLPAHRGDEVTAEIIDSPRSVVFDQAENRLHVQKAILMLLLGDANAFPARSSHA